MLHAGHFTMRHLSSFIVSFVTLTASILFFDVNAFATISATVIAYFATASITKFFQKRKILQTFGLTKTEYDHINEQLQTAQARLNTLQKQFLRIRSVSSFKHINDITRTSKRIITMIKKDPRRFYSAEQFFYAHLESAVTLIEKYTMLSAQPLKDSELKMALQQTTHTLNTVQELIDDDLKQVLASDIEHLKLEIDFANMSAEQKKKTIDVE